MIAQSWLAAGAVCVAAAALESFCAGKAPMAQLKALRQPKWSPPTWLWVAIGLAWYGICLTALGRLLPAWRETPLPILLLIALMGLNALANVPLFRMQRLDLALIFFIVYWPVLGIFLSIIFASDSLVFTMFAAYSAYQAYAFAWTYCLWRMNQTVN